MYFYVFLLFLLLIFNLQSNAQDFTDKFYVTHLNPDSSRRVKVTPYLFKLVGVLSEVICIFFKM